MEWSVPRPKPDAHIVPHDQTDGSMSKQFVDIQILPFEEAPQRDLTGLIEELASVGIEATLLPKASIVAPSYNPQRGQYNAEILLDRVRLAPGHCVLGVTSRDLYVEGLNFVFGLARRNRRTTIFHDDADSRAYLERLEE